MKLISRVQAPTPPFIKKLGTTAGSATGAATIVLLTAARISPME